MADANATGALWLILVLYIVAALLGSTQYDLGWFVVAILTCWRFCPSLWRSPSRPGRQRGQAYKSLMLHFAYGSNMHRSIMRKHAPAAEPIGVARLRNHRFVITADGYASVEPARAQMRARRAVAAHPAGPRYARWLGEYRGRSLPRRNVAGAGGGPRRPALVYLARPRRTGRPKSGYMEIVVAARDPMGIAAGLRRVVTGMVADAAARVRDIANLTDLASMGLRVNAIRHVIIRGRVQGVGYRAWTEYTALERGLQGWVRNCRDGNVEALFRVQRRRSRP